ncbi:MAG: hypothetical protein JOY58_13575 [Solirubrobacterales bacterium]|nr:hypothetical protein [Solirubrobacterales bacterium]
MRRTWGGLVGVVIVASLVLGLLGFARLATANVQPTPHADIRSAGPLTAIAIGDDLSCQVGHTGDAWYEFVPASGLPGDCGTLASIEAGRSRKQLYGPDFPAHAGGTSVSVLDRSFTPINQTTTGLGSSSSPYQVRTTVAAGDTGVQITETDTYVTGNDYYLTNLTAANVHRHRSLNLALYHAADCFLRGFRSGYGVIDTSSPTAPAPGCTVNPRNSPPSAIEELVPLSAGAHYLEGSAGTVWSDIAAQHDLPDTCDCLSDEGNGEAIEWEVRHLAPRHQVTLSMETRIDDPSIAAGGGYSISASASALVGGTVARIADSDTGTVASDYSATVDWGDGTSPDQNATITGANGSFAVSDHHTYAAPGSYRISVRIAYANNSANGAVASDSATIGPGPAPTVTKQAPGAGQPPAPSQVVTGQPRPLGSTRAEFSGLVNPEGSPTTVYFEYGLDGSYTAGEGTVYDQSTPPQPVGSGYSIVSESASVSSLVPNALYHVRLIATNAAGTTVGPETSFRTAKNPPPPPPVIGQTADLAPISGIVFVKPPKGKSLGRAFTVAVRSRGLVIGRGFVPLTEARQVPIGSQVDARGGSLKIVTAAHQRGKTQTGTFSSGLFKLTQLRRGSEKALVTLTLLEGAFRGAPTYASCGAHGASDGLRPVAYAAVSKRVLQTLRSRVSGRFRTRGRYSAGTVRGTVWNTSDRCDGTLTVVVRGTVDVDDFARHKTIAVHAGHRYLATPSSGHRG